AGGPASQHAQGRAEVEPCLESIVQRQVADILVHQPIERDGTARQPAQESALGGGGEEADPVVGWQQPGQGEEHAEVARASEADGGSQLHRSAASGGSSASSYSIASP